MMYYPIEYLFTHSNLQRIEIMYSIEWLICLIGGYKQETAWSVRFKWKIEHPEYVWNQIFGHVFRLDEGEMPFLAQCLNSSTLYNICYKLALILFRFSFAVYETP